MSMNFDQLLNQIEKVKLIKAFHGNNPDNVGVLTAINQQLMILEEDTNDYDRFLASEVIQLENMATMLKLIRAQKESLTYLLSKVPQNEIDATSKITSQTTYTDLEKVPNGLDTPRLSKAVEDDTKKDQMKETPKRPKFQKRIEIDEVTLDEFNLLPKYQDYWIKDGLFWTQSCDRPVRGGTTFPNSTAAIGVTFKN
ncbi:hypothetical protein HDV02_000758 [Globomyces sp. JEL0801]|nr:hypothetical protein HDV02_000758 [Globomyces sp. JEL0801]